MGRCVKRVSSSGCSATSTKTPTSLKHKKISGLLHVLASELPDVPLFHDLGALCKLVHVRQPSMPSIKSALLHLNEGYRVSISHTDAMGIKTDAPVSVLWDIIRCWVAQNPVKPQPQSSPAFVILSKEPSIQANFSPHPEVRKSAAAAAGKPRFVINPPRWGPGTRRQINLKRDKPEEEGQSQAAATDAAGGDDQAQALAHRQAPGQEQGQSSIKLRSTF